MRQQLARSSLSTMQRRRREAQKVQAASGRMLLVVVGGEGRPQPAMGRKRVKVKSKEMFFHQVLIHKERHSVMQEMFLNQVLIQ